MMDGLVIAALGMGIVFIFLTLLVFSINILAKIVNRFFPEKEVPLVQSKESGFDVKIAVAIAAAKKQCSV